MSINNVTIISSPRNWLESKAIAQLNKVAELPGVVSVIGLPDLHPGKTPVGAVVMTRKVIYPHLIGNDIGCGMSLFKMEMNNKKIKLDKLVRRLEETNLESIDFPTHTFDLSPLPLKSSLGTIGGGNHFAELQVVEKINDLDYLHSLGITKESVMLLIHSGSRGVGESIFKKFSKDCSPFGLEEGTPEFKNYWEQHDLAVNWATLNRKLIRYRLLKGLGEKVEGIEILNSTHNSLSQLIIDNQITYIHRKGAAPADRGPVVIPGSRGSLTYLVLPTGNLAYSGYSLAHGSGRKWERSVCRGRLEKKYTKESIKTTCYKSRIICKDLNLLYEEAPESYKNIDIIIGIFEELGLLKVIAAFKPLLTFKG